MSESIMFTQATSRARRAWLGVLCAALALSGGAAADAATKKSTKKSVPVVVLAISGADANRVGCAAQYCSTAWNCAPWGRLGLEGTAPEACAPHPACALGAAAYVPQSPLQCKVQVSVRIGGFVKQGTKMLPGTALSGTVTVKGPTCGWEAGAVIECNATTTTAPMSYVVSSDAAGEYAMKVGPFEFPGGMGPTCHKLKIEATAKGKGVTAKRASTIQVCVT